MTRPKGSLNKKRPDGEERLNIKDMKILAKAKGIKLKSNSIYTEICEKLGLEIKPYPTCFGKYQIAQPVTKTNINTGDEEIFESINKAAKALGMVAASILYRIKTGKITEDGLNSYSLSRA